MCVVIMVFISDQWVTKRFYQGSWSVKIEAECFVLLPSVDALGVCDCRNSLLMLPLLPYKQTGLFCCNQPLYGSARHRKTVCYMLAVMIYPCMGI